MLLSRFKIIVNSHSLARLFGFLLLFSASLQANQKNAVNQQLTNQAENFHIALNAAQNDRFDEALQIWSEMTQTGELIPELNRAVENNIAVILIKQKRYDAAKKRLDLALESDSQVATTLENLNQLYAYEAQKAYQKVFKNTPVTEPQAQWLYFDVKKAQLPSENIITDSTNADAVRIVKTQIEKWRQAWSNQKVEAYLSFYDEKAFIAKDGLSFDVWKKGRYRSLEKPKFITVFLDEIQISPISETMMRSRFLQRYHSDRFKDDVYKVLLWQKYADQWQIVQEVVLYDGH